MKKRFSQSWMRLVFYLIVNVLVSACTTLTVMWFWERGQEQPDISVVDRALATLIPAVENSPTPTIAVIIDDHTGEDVIHIDNVIGAGDVSTEIVILKRVGEGELNLEGWCLRDADGNQYNFPLMTLYEGGTVQLHTTTGIDTVTDLYWGRTNSVWKTGETVAILDRQGKIRATFSVP